jgi:glycosyltransferase involved in cell wall biosynthesis
MPAYNEESNISTVVEDWYPLIENGNSDSRMVVADGGSKDKTLKILFDLQKCYPKLEVVSMPGTDHGTKVIFLYKYAIKNGADWIFQTDSDGQTRAEEFLAFWQMRDSYDAVMGNRIKRGDGFFRKIVEDVLRIYLEVFFHASVPDANAPFRLMKSALVKKYIGLMPSDFNLPNAILAACFSRYKDRVVYKEITFRPRQGGKNSINFKKIAKIGMESIHSFILIRRKMIEYESHL